MTPEETEKHIKKINNMSITEMIHLRRSAPFGHIYLNNTFPFFKVFTKRFIELGGFDMSNDIRDNKELKNVLLIATCLRCDSNCTQSENQIEIDWNNKKVYFKCSHCGYDNLSEF